MGMIWKLYGRHYDIYPIYVDTRDVGHHGASRKRVYIIMSHQKSVKQVYDCNRLYRKIAEAMKLFVATKPADYFIAEPRDLLLEAQRTAGVRKLHLKQKATQPCFFLD